MSGPRVVARVQARGLSTAAIFIKLIKANMWGQVRFRQFLCRALRLLNNCASYLRNVCIFPTTLQRVHLTYKSCAFDLQKLCIRPKKVVHPTYKSFSPDLQNCASDLQKLCIRSTKGLHPTYRSVQPKQVGYTTFFSMECVSDIQFIGPTAARSC